MRLFAFVVVAFGLLSSTGDRSAFAKGYQLEIGGFAGAHFFSADNALGRVRGQPPMTALQHSGALGARVGIFFHPNVGIEAELGVIPTTTRGANVDVVAIEYRAQLVANILTGRVRPFVLAGGGGFSSTSSNHSVILVDTDGEFHAGIGVKGEVNRARTFGLRFDARAQFSPGLDKTLVPEFELFAGLYGLIGKFPAKVLPVVVPPVVVPVDLDGDDDGIVDRIDKCPTTKGFEENEGCPDVDSDSDGIVDRKDKCRLEMETVNGYQDDDGCPDVDPAVELQSRAVEGVLFAAGKADLDPASYPILDRIAQALNDVPQVKLEIVGHTDNVGPRDNNIALSLLRAEAVKTYFVTKGVAPGRLSSTGFGPDKPVADNKDETGRAKNRRVEMRFSK